MTASDPEFEHAFYSNDVISNMVEHDSGRGNSGANYTLGGQVLECTHVEKDLGVLVDNQLKFHENSAAAAKKANQVLGLVKRCFSNLDESSVPILFKCMVRPHLEYANVVWGPHFSGDQALIERVQHRATRLVPALQELPYSSRLQKLHLPSLSYRRVRGDMIQMYKIMTRRERVEPEEFFEISQVEKTRGHAYKLKVPLAKAAVRRHSFAIRAVQLWNSLPSSVVDAESVNCFKSRLDKHWSQRIHIE
ncbi:hypothetical protein Bbelb_081180 [Branchiostoma belcheri]|nr:hypothetical protein Bbelb_081180 [Branchiostoma belcheri]